MSSATAASSSRSVSEAALLAQRKMLAYHAGGKTRNSLRGALPQPVFDSNPLLTIALYSLWGMMRTTICLDDKLQPILVDRMDAPNWMPGQAFNSFRTELVSLNLIKKLISFF